MPNNPDRLRDYARKDYVDAKCKGIEDTVDSKFAGIESNVNTARESMEKRLEGMNEFRNQLKDQTASFVTRVEYNQLKDLTASYVTHAEYSEPHHRLEDDIKGLRESRANLEGKASQASVMVAHLFSAIAMLTALGALATMVFGHK